MGGTVPTNLLVCTPVTESQLGDEYVTAADVTSGVSMLRVAHWWLVWCLKTRRARDRPCSVREPGVATTSRQRLPPYYSIIVYLITTVMHAFVCRLQSALVSASILVHVVHHDGGNTVEFMGQLKGVPSNVTIRSPPLYQIKDSLHESSRT